MKAFSLFELVIVLLIIAIISSLSYISYNRYIIAARRIEAKTALFDLTHRLEHYYAENHSYADASLEKLLVPNMTENGFYLLMLNANVQNYFLTAVPQGNQAKDDTLCGNLTLDQTGKKGISGSASISECW